MQTIRKAGYGSTFFVGFKYVGMGKIEPQWATLSEGSGMAMVFMPCVPESTIEDLDKAGVPYVVETWAT